MTESNMGDEPRPEWKQNGRLEAELSEEMYG